MKTNRYFRHFTRVLAIFLVASLPAFAKNSRSLKLLHSATLNGTEIAAGDYQVSWESHSPDVTVTLKGRHVIATAQGQWVERDAKYEEDAVVYETNGDGSRTLLEIRFAGMKQALVFGESS